MHNWKNLLKLLASVTAVQLIGFILLPLFSRLYTKADYGVLGMLMSVVGLLNPLASARYDQAVFVAKTGNRLQLLRVLGIGINVLFTFTLVVLCLLAPTWLVGTSYERAIPYLFIIPLTVFTSGLFSMLAAGANAEGAYSSLSLASLLQGYINNGLKVVCGWASMGVWGFALAFNSGMAVACSLLGFQQRGEWLRGVTWRRLKVVASHYQGFPKYTTLMVTTAMLITNILAMFLPNYYKMEEIGIITMLYMITRRPAQVYSEATGRIYARRLVEYQAIGRAFLPDLHRVSVRLLGLALVGAVISPWLAEPLVSLVLGEQWVQLGKLIPWLIPFLLMESHNYIFCFIPDVLKKQRAYLLLQLLCLVAEISFISFVAPRVSFDIFLRTYFIFAAIEYGLIYLWFYRLVKANDKQKTLAPKLEFN